MNRQVLLETDNFLVGSFYKFFRIVCPGTFKLKIERICHEAGVLGTILIAPEGLNGTICGTQGAVYQVLNFLWRIHELADLEVKFSNAQEKVFKSMRVRVRDEIVTLKQKSLNPGVSTGSYVRAKDWNAVICDPDTIVVDTRNFYEHALGSFKGSVKARTKYFREFPQWMEKNYGDCKEKKVAMFCTGGIRCEKASALLIEKGYKNVSQLKGGILKYFEEIKLRDSLWEGDCFVFDQRVSLNQRLETGDFFNDPHYRIPQKKEKNK